ncbi:hypothetical protein [Serratia ficaria]|uniref:hypothetical protein n=1 Tax=Serratia ficaria TaxID=61651 RepID=UPI0021BDA27C
MNTLEAIQQRRATKQFDAQHRMTLEEKKALLGRYRISPATSACGKPSAYSISLKTPKSACRRRPSCR